MAVSTIPGIGGIVDATPASSATITVPTGAYTDVATMSLPRGIWVIAASCRFSSNMTGQIIRANLTANNYATTLAIVLGPGDNGGGLSMSGILNATAASTSVELRMYQGSGSDKGAQVFAFRAVRIA